MTGASRRAEAEAYRRRLAQLREEQRDLAGREGEQLALPIEPGDVAAVEEPRRRRGWVEP